MTIHDLENNIKMLHEINVFFMEINTEDVHVLCVC